MTHFETLITLSWNITDPRVIRLRYPEFHILKFKLLQFADFSSVSRALLDIYGVMMTMKFGPSQNRGKKDASKLQK